MKRWTTVVGLLAGPELGVSAGMPARTALRGSYPKISNTDPTRAWPSFS